MQALKNYVHLLQSIIANLLFGSPSKKLKIIAITGTDGKTTTSTLTYHILNTAGKKVALISTVAAYIGDSEIDTGFHVTTPTAFALQKLLRTIANKKFEYVVMEVTSHGIDQNRVWGITPAIAGITNVTHEHLDYHKTYDNYVQTKAKILTRAGVAFINKDHELSFEKLKTILESAHQEWKPYSTKSLDSKVKNSVTKRFGKEEYNHQNSALAVAIAKEIGISDKKISEGITSFVGVPGRMQHIPNSRGLTLIVDFAHTPNALEKALMSQKLEGKGQKKTGKLIVIFGCAGLRDHTKRPMMGEIASRIADYVILTAEDPRTEDVQSIITQIKSGVQGEHEKIISIPDRYDAIKYAIKTLAKPGDTVIVTGKGHEKSMCFGRTEYPWNDADTIQKILSE